MARLDQLVSGQTARVTAIGGDPALVQRLYEMGLAEGEPIEFVGKAPLGDPIEIRVSNTRLSLRRAEAAGVEVQILVSDDRGSQCGPL
jgi:ferrous iron transport protein A